eukprot:7954702-Lingulodinium_polyedra.AAC.1
MHAAGLRMVPRSWHRAAAIGCAWAAYWRAGLCTACQYPCSVQRRPPPCWPQLAVVAPVWREAQLVKVPCRVVAQ